MSAPPPPASATAAPPASLIPADYYVPDNPAQDEEDLKFVVITATGTSQTDWDNNTSQVKEALRRQGVTGAQALKTLPTSAYDDLTFLCPTSTVPSGREHGRREVRVAHNPSREDPVRQDCS